LLRQRNAEVELSEWKIRGNVSHYYNIPYYTSAACLICFKLKQVKQAAEDPEIFWF